MHYGFAAVDGRGEKNRFPKAARGFRTSAMSSGTIGFIGCGKMASALVEGILKAGLFSPGEIFVSDRYAEAVQSLVKKTGVQACASNADVARAAATVLICVKPDDVGDALAEIQPVRENGLVISIAAGVTLATLGYRAGSSWRVVRVMPNTPALINQGAAGYTLGETATTADAAAVEAILGAVGKVFRVRNEALLDAVTGLSGSGPAYVFTIIEALADGGVLMGLQREMALQLAAQTVAGAAKMVLESGTHPAQLRDAVTSPGGTTIAGIEALEHGGLRAALINAVRAATERAQELGETAV